MAWARGLTHGPRRPTDGPRRLIRGPPVDPRRDDPNDPSDDRRGAVTLERVNAASQPFSSSSSSSSSSSAGAGAPKPGVPPRLLRGIHAVRKRLPRATDFGELFDCFDDRIASAPELWEHSHMREHELLLAIAVAVGREHRPGFEPRAGRLFEIGDTGFWHGCIMGSNALACIFYDEGVELGLVAVSNAFDGSNRTDFVRFGRVVIGRPTVTVSPGRTPC